MTDSEKPAPKRRRKPTQPAPDAPLDAERLEKIARIKKALDDGTYHVSSEDVARKLIDHMLQPKK